MSVEDTEQFIGLFGIREENIPLFKEELGVDIFAHGGEVTLTGEPEKVELAKLTLEKLREIILRGDPVDRTRIRYAIELAGEGKADRIGEIMRDVIAITYRGKQVKCKTLGQKQYVDAIKANTATFAVGPAGTGKTYTAVALAVKALKNKQIKRIILTRPAVEAGENLGFLPGDLRDKLDPYLQPLYDALWDMMPMQKLMTMMEDKVIEIAPLAFMRGRTLDNASVILDEAQNATSAQLKMFLTRMGKNAKFFITGDITQIDLPKHQQSGLILADRILRGVKGIDFIYMDNKDVVRHHLVTKIINRYELYENEMEEAAQKRRAEREAAKLSEAKENGI